MKQLLIHTYIHGLNERMDEFTSTSRTEELNSDFENDALSTNYNSMASIFWVVFIL